MLQVFGAVIRDARQPVQLLLKDHFLLVGCCLGGCTLPQQLLGEHSPLLRVHFRFHCRRAVGWPSWRDKMLRWVLLCRTACLPTRLLLFLLRTKRHSSIDGAFKLGLGCCFVRSRAM